MYQLQLLIEDVVMVIGGTVVIFAGIIAFCYIMEFILAVIGAPHDEQ